MQNIISHNTFIKLVRHCLRLFIVRKFARQNETAQNYLGWSYKILQTEKIYVNLFSLILQAFVQTKTFYLINMHLLINILQACCKFCKSYNFDV